MNVIVLASAIVVATVGVFAVAGSQEVDLICRTDGGGYLTVAARQSEISELPGRWFVISRGAERPIVAQDCEVMP